MWKINFFFLFICVKQLNRITNEKRNINECEDSKGAS